MAEHNELGSWGEDEAAKYLETRGYEIVERDWKVGKRDLDIIAVDEDKTHIVFVEVKTRSSDDYTEPEEAVDIRKIRNLAFAANAYLKTHPTKFDIRFDVVSIVGKRPRIDRIQHIEDAFNPMLAF